MCTSPSFQYSLFVEQSRTVELAAVDFADWVLMVPFPMSLCPLYFSLIGSWMLDWVDSGSFPLARPQAVIGKTIRGIASLVVSLLVIFSS